MVSISEVPSTAYSCGLYSGTEISEEQNDPDEGCGPVGVNQCILPAGAGCGRHGCPLWPCIGLHLMVISVVEDRGRGHPVKATNPHFLFLPGWRGHLVCE